MSAQIDIEALSLAYSRERCSGRRGLGDGAGMQSSGIAHEAGDDASSQRTGRRQSATPAKLPVLQDLTIQIPAGQSVALIGPSGCGKSSLLQILAGLQTPTSGHASIAGVPVGKPRQQTAYIPQNLGIFPWKTVWQNAALGLVIRKVDKQVIQRKTAAALEAVGLAEFAHEYPKSLSGGMRQRLALARALALDMDVLLMDEPFSALDALTRESMQQTVLDMWRDQGFTQVLVTHSIEEAAFLGQRIIVLGQRPAVVVADIANPGAGTPDYRDSAPFAAVCHQVRTMLETAHE